MIFEIFVIQKFFSIFYSVFFYILKVEFSKFWIEKLFLLIFFLNIKNVFEIYNMQIFSSIHFTYKKFGVFKISDMKFFFSSLLFILKFFVFFSQFALHIRNFDWIIVIFDTQNCSQFFVLHSKFFYFFANVNFKIEFLENKISYLCRVKNSSKNFQWQKIEVIWSYYS